MSATRVQILVVEDEEDIQELLRYNLSREGFAVRIMQSAEEALHATRSDPPGLILLDLMLPGMDGLELCRLLKTDDATAHLPIMMLTAKGEEADIVTGLELGADDYLTKPFSPKVLIARIRTVLRRQSRESPAETGGDRPPVTRHGITIHPGRQEVKVDGDKLTLTYSEFHILLALARKPGWVLTRGQIVEAVRGDDYPVTDRAVDVQIVGLRRKLGEAGGFIETVRGVGYRFKE